MRREVEGVVNEEPNGIKRQEKKTGSEKQIRFEDTESQRPFVPTAFLESVAPPWWTGPVRPRDPPYHLDDHEIVGSDGGW